MKGKPFFNPFWFRPVDAAPLTAFRILFGLIMIWEIGRYFAYSRIEKYYIDPLFFFTYPLFSFVSPLPGNWMYLVFILMGTSALFIALGLFYRIAAACFFLTYSYAFLIDCTQYNNHYYFICLLGLLMFCIPAHRNVSLDACRKPGIQTAKIPFWCLFLLKFQIIIVYFFGGVAKLNSDWLRGEPMRHWLEDTTTLPWINEVLTSEPSVYFFSYGGLVFDLFIGFALLNNKTKPIAVFLVLMFHLTNAWMFSIGIFPYLMIAATVLFLQAETINEYFLRFLSLAKGEGGGDENLKNEPRISVLIFLGIYCAIQILLPLRHWLYPGNVNWTEEGHRFSWHMKLRDKYGDIGFVIRDPSTGKMWKWRMEDDLTQRQIGKMSGRPDMILQYASYIKDTLNWQGYEGYQIFADSTVSLNFREPSPLIDPSVDLSKVEFSPWIYNNWILHLEED